MSIWRGYDRYRIRDITISNSQTGGYFIIFKTSSVAKEPWPHWSARVWVATFVLSLPLSFEFLEILKVLDQRVHWWHFWCMVRAALSHLVEAAQADLRLSIWDVRIAITGQIVKHFIVVVLILHPYSCGSGDGGARGHRWFSLEALELAWPLARRHDFGSGRCEGKVWVIDLAVEEGRVDACRLCLRCGWLLTHLF